MPNTQNSKAKLYIEKSYNKQLSAGLLYGSVSYLSLGYISKSLGFDIGDSFWVRLPVSLVPFVGWLLCLRYEFFERNLRFLFLISSALVLIQYYPFFFKSNYHYYYAMGLMIIHFFIFSILPRLSDLIIFTIISFVVCLLNTQELNKIFITILTIGVSLSILTYFTLFKTRNWLLNGMIERESKLEALNLVATQAAHDIRSPVNALKALASKIQSESDNKIILDAISRIDYIAEGLLSGYRQINNVYDNQAKSDFIIEINKLILEKKASYQNTNISLGSKIESLQLSAIYSRELIRIISNIIQNSIEATVDIQSKISVSIQSQDDFVFIVVQDNGKGISEENINRVFERGFTSSKKNGTGLGLAHAKEYIESIGGQISLSSKLGKGTLVSIKIPIR